MSFDHAADGETLQNLAFNEFHELFAKLKEKAVSVSVHVAVDVRKGITETKQWVDNMIAIAEDWVKV